MSGYVKTCAWQTVVPDRVMLPNVKLMRGIGRILSQHEVLLQGCLAALDPATSSQNLQVMHCTYCVVLHHCSALVLHCVALYCR